jgi:hypothetical protein
MKVLAVSDVTTGYGTPQLPLLVTSLADHYQADAFVIEPVQPELKGNRALPSSLHMIRIPTSDHPHSQSGRTEYVWRAAELVNEIEPDILVVSCTYCLPIVFRIQKRPRRVIYYSLESIRFYGDFDVAMNRRVGDRIDIVIFPEENRAVLEKSRCGFERATSVVLYNATARAGHLLPAVPAAERNDRILYAGLIAFEKTFANFYTDKRLRGAAIDLFGAIREPDGQAKSFIESLAGDIRYRGQVGNQELQKIRRNYLYSIVMWNPSEENQLYAAPNKFFESVADGVPPLAAPHPQCSALIRRYGCGLRMEDWSFASFRQTLRRAMAIQRSQEWESLVAGCRRATELELNWDAQFRKLIPYL